MEEKKTLDNGIDSLCKRIADLEREKLEIKKQIEALMAEMSKESGDESFKKRKYEIGLAPNDWFVGSEEQR